MRFNKEEFEEKIVKYVVAALLIWGLVQLIEGMIDGRCCHKACIKQGYIDSDYDFEISFGHGRSAPIYPYHPSCTCFSVEDIADPDYKKTGSKIIGTQIPFEDN